MHLAGWNRNILACSQPVIGGIVTKLNYCCPYMYLEGSWHGTWKKCEFNVQICFLCIWLKKDMHLGCSRPIIGALRPQVNYQCAPPQSLLGSRPQKNVLRVTCKSRCVLCIWLAEKEQILADLTADAGVRLWAVTLQTQWWSTGSQSPSWNNLS